MEIDRLPPPPGKQNEHTRKYLGIFPPKYVHGVMSHNSNLRSAHHKNLKTPLGTQRIHYVPCINCASIFINVQSLRGITSRSVIHVQAVDQKNYEMRGSFSVRCWSRLGGDP